ncbi:hypothetical protein CCMSSC00406_0003704 [Pleurotus cornucopiae]|uniref:Uncharacterized protein n=1 Tax=Pleurotus cornucopiae TaxID=5321 RepID=A0ACB7ISB2_PLECO|nr:hypothetical protein CCMSSC00406_0003704 [Pleurotus cornucopiae]
MRNRKRHRAEDEYTDEVGSAGVFSHSRASDERALDGIKHQVQKRRKTGVNTRFDRMVETMNITRPSPSTVSSNRARSSSLSSYDPPKTPSDAYNYSYQEGTGSVASATRGEKLPVVLEDIEASEMFRVPSFDQPEGREDGSAPLPGWLAHTFLALDKKHPLRSLLPKDIQESGTHVKGPHRRRSSQSLYLTSPLPSLHEDDIRPAEGADSVFAFGPPEQDSPMHIDTGRSLRNLKMYETKVLSPNFIRQDDPLEYQTSNAHLWEGLATTLGTESPRNLSTAFIPFAKPGPCSALAPASNQTPLKPLLFNIPPIADVPDAYDSGSAYDDMNMLSHSRMLDDHSSNPSLCVQSDGYMSPEYDTGYEDDLIEENTYVDGMDLIPSSDTPGPSSDTLTNLQSSLFATPGPGYRTAHPVYFDSPAEDLPNSDPLDESEYQVDWGNIGFQWKPFMRGHNGEEDIDTKPKPLPIPVSVLSEISPPFHDRQPSVTNQVEIPPSSARRTPQDKQQASPEVQPQPQPPPPETPVKSLLEQDVITYDLFVQELDAPRTPTKASGTDFYDFQDCPSSQQSLAAPGSPFTQVSAEEAHSCGRITPESELGPVFAPAPGIYISPLKDAECSDSSQVDQLDESVADVDELCSQSQPHTKSTVIQSPPSQRRIHRRTSSSNVLPLSPINEHLPTSSQITTDSIESWEE